MSPTALAATAQQVPALLLTEAGLAFLGFEAFGLQSLGNLIARGAFRGDVPMLAKWWVSGFSVAALASTVLAVMLVANAPSDAMDPRGTRR